MRSVLCGVILSACALTMGCAVAVADRPADKSGLCTSVFYLPFPGGTKCVVLRGNDEGPSHRDEWNRYAFDFALGERSPVCASADGVVIGARADSVGPTGRPEDNNFVRLRHADGTVTEYLHLAEGGALAIVGEEVLAGDLIGYSGNTGSSTVPHLHFGVRRSARGPSVACRFADVPGEGVPRAGDTVESGNVAMRELPGVRASLDVVRIHNLAAVVDGRAATGEDVRQLVTEAVEAERRATEAGPVPAAPDPRGIVPVARPDYREATTLFEKAFTRAEDREVRAAIARHIDALRRSR